MKKLFAIILLFTIVIGCKKKTTTTAPASTSSTTNTTASALSSLDSALVGNWIMDSLQSYNNGVYIGSALYSDPFNCHLLLNSTYQTPGDPQGQKWKTAMHGLECNNSSTVWRTTSGMLDITNALYQIISYNSNSLVILYGTMGTGGSGAKWHMHK